MIVYVNQQTVKYKILYSVVSCGSQVWAYESVGTLEKFQRYFLPQNTPDHVLMIEPEKESLFLNAIKQNFNYILKI